MDTSKITTLNIFPTNIIIHKWQNVDNLNDELKEIIFEMAEITPGVKYSNVGGYHSPDNVLSWKYPCIDQLISMIQTMSQVMANNDGLKEGDSLDLSFSGWSNIMSNGNYHACHRHPNNFWSGCYYIDDGNPDETVESNSNFEIIDPRPGAGMHTSELLSNLNYRVKPTTGLMVMFPSWLDHYVHPYIGDSKRVTIAFNVRIIQ